MLLQTRVENVLLKILQSYKITGGGKLKTLHNRRTDIKSKTGASMEGKDARFSSTRQIPDKSLTELDATSVSSVLQTPFLPHCKIALH